MARAITLSKRGLPAPNPHVGCVIVKNGQAVGEGWHAYAGGPHAEAMALFASGGDAEGADAYVTLEPCNHQGRQPPCAEALIRAGIRRVWMAMPDPNPNVGGGGADALREAGIAVEDGLLADAAREANTVWLKSMEWKRPFVTIKAACSLDGRLALPNGQSQWITGERARRTARRLRAEMGAVLVGRGTVEADDPRLTCRIRGHPNEPVRIVIDPHRRLSDRYQVFNSKHQTWRVVDQNLARPGDFSAQVSNGEVVLNRLLHEFWAKGLTGILVEGGAQTISSFLKSGLADRLDLFMGNVLLGSGQSWLESPLVERLDRALRWTPRFIRRLDDDLWVRYEPQIQTFGPP